MIPHNRLTYGKREDIAVQRIISCGYWAGGKEVEHLEYTVKKVTKRKYAIAVSSGFSALRLALLALGVKQNDEVIIPAYCCVALPNAVLSCGATPVPVDIINNNWTIDPSDIRPNMSTKTKAIVAVNTFGVNVSFKEVNTLNIPVIEDCAHALGKNGHETVYGKQGLVSTGSFYATKLIGGGEGGIVMTDNKDISEFVHCNRDYTDKIPSGSRMNDKMSNIHAALSLCQLKRLNSFIRARQRIALLYNKEFIRLQEEFPEFVIPGFDNRIWYRYVVYCKNLPATKLIDELKLNKVSAAMPISNWMNESQIKEHPVSSLAYTQLVSLPIYPSLSKHETKTVVRAVKKSLKNLFYVKQ